MNQKIITVLILLIALIHLIPVLGIVGTAQLESLYGVTFTDKNIEILMRHRAVLFGILGMFFAYAAFKPKYQPLAFIAAFVSLVSFFFLAFTVGDFNHAINRVVLVDVVAITSLCIAVSLFYFNDSK